MSEERSRNLYQPGVIYLEKSVRDSLITRNVLRSLPDTPVREIETTEPLLNDYKQWNPTIPRTKKALVLARHRGTFFKPCPGQQTRGDTRNVCCNYFVINFASNCHMECSYCYLQSYLNFPYMIVYANCSDLLDELDQAFSADPGTLFRVGTGELADSLGLDPITGYSVPLVEFFSKRNNAVLELKTKSDCVDRLLGLDHGEKTVIAWSMNPRYLQQTEEHKTATVEQRLKAAALCVADGYPVAFHFDPIVYYPNWERDYELLIDEIYSCVPAESIAWISLGALRMSPELKDIMRVRFPNSFLPLGELVPSADGKLRYVKPIRIKMYQSLIAWIGKRSSLQTEVYACMERPEVWSRVFGRSVPANEEVGDSLATVVLQT